ncbi:tripartite tricarboxylate transporter TctB family protein [Caldovatus sediminis]|uniref:tripartite tricarboxylate transporter TctB family protein n=1 Tax=Caldovatus sediminis TaxID=2041189 RepID=UPI00166318CA|nr:tripartite tricarboxylate transporter TctB family protein [Caldovatus sediminis]
MTALTQRTGRAAIGLLGLLLAAGYTAAGLGLPLGSADMPGPGLFPLVVGPLLALVALGLLREGWAMRDDGTPLDLPAGEEARRVVLVLAALTLHFVAMPWIGHLISASLLATAVIRLLRGGWAASAVAGVALAVAAQFLFVRLLQVPLPRGELGYWLGM